jgi:hypothetical protein
LHSGTFRTLVLDWKDLVCSRRDRNGRPFDLSVNLRGSICKLLTENGHLMTSPRKPTAGFWITVALVAVLVAYPLSFGPACWATSRTNCSVDILETFYQPILREAFSETEWIAICVRWYAGLAAAPNWHIRDGCFTEDCFWGR